MAQTVAECLTAGIDSVTVIDDIKTNGNKSKWAGGTTDTDGNAVAGTWTQSEINEVVQRNVDHLTIILAYDGTDGTPNVKDASDDKSSYTTAITTGNTYISNNS
tara:strand:- start:132 stop:443 length:312 start_codon:yes stop_codon:yes gene_type:complete